MSVFLSLIVARARNGVIGHKGRLPWHLRSDLQKFKANTIGKPCLMGRKTWDSLQLRPLPGRLNLVVSRNAEFAAKGALVCPTFEEAVRIGRDTAREDGVGEVCVIFRRSRPNPKATPIFPRSTKASGPRYPRNASSRAKKTTMPSSSGCSSAARGAAP